MPKDIDEDGFVEDAVDTYDDVVSPGGSEVEYYETAEYLEDEDWFETEAEADEADRVDVGEFDAGIMTMQPESDVVDDKAAMMDKHYYEEEGESDFFENDAADGIFAESGVFDIEEVKAEKADIEAHVHDHNEYNDDEINEGFLPISMEEMKGEETLAAAGMLGADKHLHDDHYHGDGEHVHDEEHCDECQATIAEETNMELAMAGFAFFSLILFFMWYMLRTCKEGKGGEKGDK